MTEEEILRNRYIQLQKKLYRIRNKVREAIDDYDGLFSLIKSGILINGETYEDDKLKDISKKLDSVNRDLSYDVIPKVNNRI